MKWKISLPSKLSAPSKNYYKDTTFSRMTIIIAQLCETVSVPSHSSLQTQDHQVHWILLVVPLSLTSWLSCFKLSSGRDQWVCFRGTEALAAQLPSTVLDPQHWLTPGQDEAGSNRQRKISPVGGHVLGMSSSSLPEILSFVSSRFPQGHTSALN